MGKKKTFGKVSKHDLLDWAKGYHREITVTDHDDGYLYGMVEVEGCTRQIRMSADGDFLQICDGSFDRWANSVGAETRFPWTESDFNTALDELCAIPLKKIRADLAASC
jgi:hypothetical protein